MIDDFSLAFKTATPTQFRVVAIIATFNEEDIILPAIKYLSDQGIKVYVMDNWSSDHTFEYLTQIQDSLVGLERWPQSGPTKFFEYKELLKRKEELAQELEADWFLHCDADEYRESPWQGKMLREGIYLADLLGYNAINFALLNFFPVDNGYQPGTSFVEYFQYFQFNDFDGNRRQIKAWKKQAERVNLNDSGGHNVTFPGRKIFPLKFILRHYAVRSQAHGERKIYVDRRARFDPQLTAMGWHTQYNHIGEHENFLKNPDDMLKIQDGFYENYLFQQMVEADKTIQSLHTNLLETQTQLAETRAKLAEVLNSKTWLATLSFRKILQAITPPSSLRSRIADAVNRTFFHPALTRLQEPNKLRELELIRDSGLYNQEYYLSHNPDVAKMDRDPLIHFWQYGGNEGRDPGEFFSSSYYLQKYPDVKKSGMNPLVHYLKYGEKEQRITRLPQPDKKAY